MQLTTSFPHSSARIPGYQADQDTGVITQVLAERGNATNANAEQEEDDPRYEVGFIISVLFYFIFRDFGSFVLAKSIDAYMLMLYLGYLPIDPQLAREGYGCYGDGYNRGGWGFSSSGSSSTSRRGGWG